MRRAIVNCAIGHHYPNLQVKMRDACQHFGGADLMFFTDYPAGCPKHSRMQYAFKIFALAEAIKAGYQHVLWMDCTFKPVKPIDQIWETIERHGWYIPPQGDAVLGKWCSDAALKQFGMSRDEAMTIPLVYSGLVGLDLGSRIGESIWESWRTLYEAGTFNGPHINKPGAPFHEHGNKFVGHVSSDPSVEGHRHDEAALSFVLHSHGLIPKNRRFLTVESESGCIGRNF